MQATSINIVRPVHAVILGMFCVSMAQAHVPYIEDKDYPEGEDFVIRDAAQSKASMRWAGSSMR